MRELSFYISDVSVTSLQAISQCHIPDSFYLKVGGIQAAAICSRNMDGSRPMKLSTCNLINKKLLSDGVDKLGKRENKDNTR